MTYREMTEEWIPSTRLHIEERTAKKQYRCQHCTTPILPGEVYVSSCWIVDGDFTYERSHPNYLGECILGIKGKHPANSTTGSKE